VPSPRSCCLSFSISHGMPNFFGSNNTLRISAYPCSGHCARPCDNSEHRYDSRMPSCTLSLRSFTRREISCTKYRLHYPLQILSLSHVHLRLLRLLLLSCFALIPIHHDYDATYEEDILCLLATTLERPLRYYINNCVCQELIILLLPSSER
jgi:hypothetical protein